MRVLLTGGAGYIGSHTAVELLRIGHDITVIDNLANSSRESLRRVEQISGRQVELHVVDLTDAEGTRRVFERIRIDAVVHFAGLKAVGDSVADPLRYYQTNLLSTLVLLSTMKDFGVRKLVFSSSATVYGGSADSPLTEASAVGQGLKNPYGHSKAMIEQILTDASFANPQLEVSVLRYFNPIGAHESGLIGEDPRQTPNNLFPFVSQVAAGVRGSVAVFGDNYATPDGTGVRDYVHVMDLAEGHAAAIQKLEKGIAFFNLGTGRGTSVLQVIEAFSRVVDRPIPYRIVAPRAGDVAVSYADATRAERELGWIASRSLGDACRDAWLWQSNNPHGYGSHPPVTRPGSPPE
jgi:UDP-glucose 4-epimerase